MCVCGRFLLCSRTVPSSPLCPLHLPVSAPSPPHSLWQPKHACEEAVQRCVAFIAAAAANANASAVPHILHTLAAVVAQTHISNQVFNVATKRLEVSADPCDVHALLMLLSVFGPRKLLRTKDIVSIRVRFLDLIADPQVSPVWLPSSPPFFCAFARTSTCTCTQQGYQHIKAVDVFARACVCVCVRVWLHSFCVISPPLIWCVQARRQLLFTMCFSNPILLGQFKMRTCVCVCLCLCVCVSVCISPAPMPSLLRVIQDTTRLWRTFSRMSLSLFRSAKVHMRVPLSLSTFLSCCCSF